MTREEAMEWVIPALKHTWNEENVKRILEALEQEPKWIPVSERFPEKQDEYLIVWSGTIGNLTILPAAYGICEYEIYGDNAGWIVDDFAEMGYGDVQVLAWMPLPEYKTEEEE